MRINQAAVLAGALLATAALGAPTKVDPKSFKSTPSGLKYSVVKPGKGDAAEKGRQVFVHYTGWLQSNGQKFDSSVDRGEPIDFILGEGEVIPGWDEGVTGMKAGEKRQLIIPSKLGYGATGTPGGPIPPNATLVFDVELVKLGELRRADERPVVDEKSLKSTESGLRYAILKEGSGKPVEKGQRVSVHYTGWLKEGAHFDSSRLRGAAVDLVLGRSRVVPGLDEGLMGMRPGEQRVLLIPAKLGYGERGTPGGPIPPNADLTFKVELVAAGDLLPDNERPSKVDADKLKTTASGLKYAVLQEGAGETAEKGQRVSVHYTGWLESNGEKFDSSVDRGQPFVFPLGAGRVIKGWDEGVAGMKVGEKRRLVIPAALGYGERGVGPIPPNATLLFDVELLKIEK